MSSFGDFLSFGLRGLGGPQDITYGFGSDEQGLPPRDLNREEMIKARQGLLEDKSMSTSSAAPGALLALWSRDDVRAAIVDFLSTRTIATLPFVAKPLRELQSRLLITATTRRGKTVPNPPTTRALLDALLVGEPKHFCEDWERGLEAWYRLGGTTGAIAASRLVLSGPTSLRAPSGGKHIGFARPLRGPSLRRLRNMLVTRFRVEMSYSWCSFGGEVGSVLLCGPYSPATPSDLLWTPTNMSADATRDMMCGLKFRGGQFQNYLFFGNGYGSETVIVEGATPNTQYTVDVIFRHESVTSGRCAADVSVNGQRVPLAMPLVVRPLSSIHLYNLNSGESRIGNIDIWYERATPDQSRNELSDSESE